MRKVFLLTLMVATAIIASPAYAGALVASRAFNPPTYTAGESVTVTLTVEIHTAGEFSALGITENSPTGSATIDPASVRCIGYNLYPRPTPGGGIDIPFLQPPAGPISITYVALIASNADGDLAWSGSASWRLRTPEGRVSENLPNSTLSEYVIPPVVTHTADQNGDFDIGLDELLRAIQFYNSLAFHCEAGTEDGYAPGLGQVANDYACTPHDSDYMPQDWDIEMDELLRLIQFYNSGGYMLCPQGEDGFGVAGNTCD
ncbi:MAG: hypothetical protein KBB55_01385 [Candidatus Buchananbacteria bacterium]|nr:hypothetical protein [Candidatus Buchananbacteria bacterium]